MFLVTTLKALYDRSVARTSFTLVMLAIAAAMGLLLGIVGIYAVIVSTLLIVTGVLASDLPARPEPLPLIQSKHCERSRVALQFAGQCSRPCERRWTTLFAALRLPANEPTSPPV